MITAGRFYLIPLINDLKKRRGICEYHIFIKFPSLYLLPVMLLYPKKYCKKCQWQNS